MTLSEPEQEITDVAPIPPATAAFDLAAEGRFIHDQHDNPDEALHYYFGDFEC